MTETFEPVFIVGTKRSGTTLLAATLDRHTQIAVTPETHFLTDFVPRWQKTFDKLQRDELIDKALADQYIGDLKLDYRLVANNLPPGKVGPRELLMSLLRAYTDAKNKVIPGEKTPDHINFVPRILSWFPQARIVCIVRDGRDVARSMVRMPSDPYCSLRRQSLIWADEAQKTLEYEHAYPERFLRVHFEELVSKPAHVMGCICEFLGVAKEPALVAPTGDVAVIPDWEMNWKSKVFEPIDSRRSQAWRSDTSKKDLWEMNSVMGPYLKALGYDQTDMDGCGYLQKSRHSVTNLVFRLLFTPRFARHRKALKLKLQAWGAWKFLQPTKKKDALNSTTEES